MAGLGIRRFKAEVPNVLAPMNSGAELLSLISGCHGSCHSHSDNLTDDEVELVGGFLQSMKDWVDVASDLEPLGRLRAAKSLKAELDELAHRGFLVFAAKERQRLEGGVGAPSDYFVFHVAVARQNDPNIIYPNAKQNQKDG